MLEGEKWLNLLMRPNREEEANACYLQIQSKGKKKNLLMAVWIKIYQIESLPSRSCQCKCNKGELVHKCEHAKGALTTYKEGRHFRCWEWGRDEDILSEMMTDLSLGE